MKMFSRISWSLIPLSLLFFCIAAFADDATAISPSDFLTQVLTAVKSFGGLSTMLKISAVIMLLVASMKVSVLNSLIWSKLGAAQAWVAPLLALIGGALGIGTNGTAVTLASVFAYMAAGVGAVALHELLDTVKSVPGIGTIWVSIIDLIESFLGGPASQTKTS